MYSWQRIHTYKNTTTTPGINTRYKTHVNYYRLRNYMLKENYFIIYDTNNNQYIFECIFVSNRHRVLDTRAKYIMLHDFRLFHSNYHYLWRRIVNVIFLKYHKKDIQRPNSKDWFELSTVPFPNPIKSVLVPRRVDIWRNQIFQYKKSLFNDKTNNFNGEVLNVVYLDHVPSVVVAKSSTGNKIGGVEIEVRYFLNTCPSPALHISYLSSRFMMSVKSESIYDVNRISLLWFYLTLGKRVLRIGLQCFSYQKFSAHSHRLH